MEYLESRTGFSRDLRWTIQRAAGWPQGWLTAEEVEWELRLRDFWSRGRQAVHPDARVGMIRFYLRQRIAQQEPGSTTGWVQSGDRYRYRDIVVRPSTRSGDEPAGRGGRRWHHCVSPEAEWLRCQYGRVVNLSLDEAQVVATTRPTLRVGNRTALDLTWADEPAMRLRARVVWINEGPESWRLGAEFLGRGPEEHLWLRETIRRATLSLAMAG